MYLEVTRQDHGAIKSTMIRQKRMYLDKSFNKLSKLSNEPYLPYS